MTIDDFVCEVHEMPMQKNCGKNCCYEQNVIFGFCEIKSFHQPYLLAFQPPFHLHFESHMHCVVCL